MSSVTFTEGELGWTHPSVDKPLKTWYTIAGKLDGRKHPPLVVLHGGPGASHDYMLPLAELASSHSLPVVFYDQVGTARSTHLPEKNGDGAFWTEQLFLHELDALLSHLGIQHEYSLLGHSWGGMLGSRHATRAPAGLKKLILADAPASMALWIASVDKLRTNLARETQNTLDKHEAAGTTSDPEYEAAVGVFYENYLCRLKPMPELLGKSFGWIAQDPTVYHTMNGPSEFHITGTLKKWTVTDDIPKITANTLLINSRFDEAQDSAVQPFFNLLPKVKWVQFAESSHTPHLEETERYLKVVGDFLTLAQ